MNEQDIVRSIIAASAEPPLDASALKDDDALNALGIDSLKFMLVVIDVEQQLGRPIFKVEDVPSISTVKDIVKLV